MTNYLFSNICAKNNQKNTEHNLIQLFKNFELSQIPLNKIQCARIFCLSIELHFIYITISWRLHSPCTLLILWVQKIASNDTINIDKLQVQQASVITIETLLLSIWWWYWKVSSARNGIENILPEHIQSVFTKM